MVIQLSLDLEFMENLEYCHRMNDNGPHRHEHHHRSRNQSFSSALLDAICKSTEDEGGMIAYKKSSNRQETRNVEAENNILMRNSSYKRLVRIERQSEEDPWLNNEKSRSTRTGVFNTEKYEAEAAYSKNRELHLSFKPNMPSATSYSSDYTSDSTSNCPYLSSDAESVYKHTSSISTAKTERNFHHVGRADKACKWAVERECSRVLHGKSSVRDGDFRATEKPLNPAAHSAKIKSKSKTSKDSKKTKLQPTSPGRKLANFLNSLFMAGGTKKPKLSSSSSVSESTSYYSSERKPASISSSSSSVHSRPCLSKSSRGSKNSNGVNRSVTFYPTSVIVNEDSRPCGEKCIHRRENNPNPSNYPNKPPSLDAYKLPLLSQKIKYRNLERDSHAAAAAAKDIIAKYQKTNSIMKAVVVADLDKQDEDQEEDDDDASCSSSDLFELENLAGIDMYQKELPVYETTHLETNKAIAKGFIV